MAHLTFGWRSGGWVASGGARRTAVRERARGLTDDLEKEAPLNRVLVHDRSGRRFASVEGSRWGELILPAPEEAAPHGDGGCGFLR